MYELLIFAFVQYLPVGVDFSEGVWVEGGGICACVSLFSRAIPITQLPTYGLNACSEGQHARHLHAS